MRGNSNTAAVAGSESAVATKKFFAYLVVDMWTTSRLTPSKIALIPLRIMGGPREAELLSTAGYLCSAVDNLRSLGLTALADDIDRYIRMLEVEVFLDLVTRSIDR